MKAAAEKKRPDRPKKEKPPFTEEDARRAYLGKIVSTKYGTGPYVIESVHGPCNCPSYFDSINARYLSVSPPELPVPSEWHVHLTCKDADRPRGRIKGTRSDSDSYLNGYRLDGTSVWDDDRLIFHGAVQVELCLPNEERTYGREK